MEVPPKRGGRWRHWRRSLLVLVPIIAAAGVAFVLAGDKDRAPAPRAGNPGELLQALSGAVPDLPSAPPPSAAEAHSPGVPSYPLVRVRHGQRVVLRSAPGGRRVARLGAQTEFGSPRTFYIAERRGDWLGVPSAAMPNGRLGWIRGEPAQLDFGSTSYSLRADVSSRTVEVRYGRRLVRRIPVTVGRSGSETPPGTFSVTDGLAGRGVGPWYGCCVLALSGHQPDLPSNWIGGDRIAIHGTPGTVGAAASLGCLRASNRDMVTLFALVPLGAPVFIRV